MKEIFEVFKKYKVEIDAAQAEEFERYYEFLIETNKNMNLTAITDEKEVLFKHFLDSVLPLDEFGEKCSVVDVGSGAGFPALPIKILRPDLEITLVDSLNKRVKFLNDTINMLNLQKIEAIHARAEDFCKQNRERFDLATARAVAPLNTLLEYLLPLVKVGGHAVIYKSSKLDEEILQAKKALSILGGEIEKVKTFHIDEFDLDRKILIVKKARPTPKLYPRDKNKPRLLPL